MTLIKPVIVYIFLPVVRIRILIARAIWIAISLLVCGGCGYSIPRVNTSVNILSAAPYHKYIQVLTYQVLEYTREIIQHSSCGTETTGVGAWVGAQGG